MQEDSAASQFYQQRITKFTEILQRLYKTKQVIAWVRFFIFIAVCMGVYIAWHSSTAVIFSVVVTGFILFVLAVSKDTDNKNSIRNVETLLFINKEEINCLEEKYAGNYNGQNLAPANHVYAKDLDVFGEASLFQYINRCSAEQGLQLFAQRLLEPLAKPAIIQQQQAIKELLTKMDWWQQFRAFGINEKITVAAETRIQQWLDDEQAIFINPTWKVLLYAFPVITLGSVYLYLDDILPAPIFSLLLLLFFFTAFLISRKIQPVYVLLSRLVPVVSTIYKQLNWFEKEAFTSEFLVQLKNMQSINNNKTASFEIKKLQTILNLFEARLNVLAFIILNTFLLWDLWQITALNTWKRDNKGMVRNWFSTIAQLETTGSFATLAFNNSDWCFPVISDVHFTLTGSKIAHPLIPKQQRVANSFSLTGTARIDLITGSNMAGKSTFLRSLGVNMVLAYTGAPVCAESFTVSVATLMSSMRIEDNLAENTSTFYAELKKLKAIIDAVNQHKQLFILLDEILRGTNSLDRHAGSQALIKQLIKQHAVGIIATHDIELSKMESTFPSAIKNYHFDVQVTGYKLYFDYTLKEGVCRSMNASVLMKQIGIEV